MSQILYQDSQITVYNVLIVINKYYFPLATSKTILFQDIQRVALISSEGVTHRWGACSKYLNNWFPLDSKRKDKTKFIEITIKGRKIKPSITPDDPEKVFRIIWENYTPEGQKFVEENSQKQEKVPDINQKEIPEKEDQFQTTEYQLSSKYTNPDKEKIQELKIQEIQ